MSYSSESTLPKSTPVSRVRELVEILGYKPAKDFSFPGRIATYMWYESRDYKSHSGVELTIYRASPKGRLIVSTRSTVSRSYWDLTHQNKTLRMLRDLIGGDFTTDAGKNRYWRPDAKPPAPLASGCYLAMWRLHNALIKPMIYLSTRRFDGDIAREKPTGLFFIDQMNPRTLSNNMALPYVIAVWEEYFRSMFAAALKYSKQRETALKRVRLSHAHLEKVLVGHVEVERAVAESFSFQRPSQIAENFRMLDSKIDIAGTLKKPHNRRKTTLFDSIEKCVEERNAFVHAGDMNYDLSDQRLKKLIDDFEIAARRCYDHLAAQLKFEANHNY